MASFVKNTDNTKSLAIINRPNEEISKSNKCIRSLQNHTKSLKNIIPFVSSVKTDLNPLGLPPIKKEYLKYNNVEKINKISYVNRINKKVLDDIKELRKIENKMFLEELDKHDRQIAATKLNRKKINNYLYKEAIKKIKEDNDKKEILYNDNNNDYLTKDDMFKINSINKCININNEEHNNIDKLVHFANNLDFDKYLKDLEIREAIKIIKSRVENENSENVENKTIENNTEDYNNFNIRNDDNIKEDNYNERLEDEENSINNNITNNNTNKITFINHDKDWNKELSKINENKIKIENETINKCLKDKHINANYLHSKNSIRKILEREGLINMLDNDLTKKPQIKIADSEDKYCNIHTGSKEGKIKHSLIQNIIQNPEINL